MPAKRPQPIQEPPVTRGEVTRSKVLEVAHDLFLKHGFHGTSMRQIADAAGVAVGGIYNHYRSKEEIFAAVLDAYHPYHVILPALAETQGETIEEFVLNAAQKIRKGIEGVETRLLPLVFMELVEFQGRHLKALAERLYPTIAAFIQRFSERRGALRAVPVPVILRTFMSLMVGFLLTEMILKGSPLFKGTNYDWFGGMVDIYLHGIVVEDPAKGGVETEH
jgi:AcrR family transcriptional regulator